MRTLDDLLRHVRQKLVAAQVETPALDARLLVREAGKMTDSDMITMGNSPVDAAFSERVLAMAERRAAGEPVSRILGVRQFWGMEFKVTPDTLDPRPDTETLVDAALAYARTAQGKGGKLRILDLGTGTGCILLSLLKELPQAQGVGIDINAGAVTVAAGNAADLGLYSRASFRTGSWFGPLEPGEVFDLIVSNPPYIPESDIESLAVEVRVHDPILALSGGVDGLEPYKIILKDLKKVLACGGRAMFEIGRGQEKDLARLAADSTMSVCDSHTDLGGVVRVVEITHGEK